MNSHCAAAIKIHVACQFGVLARLLRKSRCASVICGLVCNYHELTVANKLKNSDDLKSQSKNMYFVSFSEFIEPPVVPLMVYTCK